MKKLLFLILFLSLAVSCWADDPESWDLLDEDCSDISDWTDNDLGTGVSEVSPAGQFHFISSDVDDQAGRYRDIGAYPDNYTFEIRLYLDTVTSYEISDYLVLSCLNDDLELQITFASDGLYIVKSAGAGNVEVGTDLVQQDTWQTWRFLRTGTIPASATCDVYLKNGDGAWSLVGNDIECAWTGSGWTDGYTDLTLFSPTISPELHIDYIKAATDLYAPTSEETTNLKLINNAQLNDCKF